MKQPITGIIALVIIATAVIAMNYAKAAESGTAYDIVEQDAYVAMVDYMSANSAALGIQQGKMKDRAISLTATLDAVNEKRLADGVPCVAINRDLRHRWARTDVAKTPVGRGFIEKAAEYQMADCIARFH